MCCAGGAAGPNQTSETQEAGGRASWSSCCGLWFQGTSRQEEAGRSDRNGEETSSVLNTNFI